MQETVDSQAELLVALRREERLRELLMTIAGALDIHTVLTAVVRGAMDLLDADAGSLPLYEAERDRLLPGRVINLPIEALPYPHRRDTGLLWQMLESGVPILLNDYAREPMALPGLVAIGVTAVLAVPLRAGPEVLGALILYRYRGRPGFNQRDVGLLEVIAKQTAIALQNARLYQAAVVAADRRHALYSASVEIGAALDSEQLYAAIHRSAARLMRCDTLAIGLLDEERQEIDYVYLWDPQGRRQGSRAPVTSGLVGYVVRYGASLRLSNCDPGMEAIFLTEPLGQDESHSLLATVLSVGDLVIGGILVQASIPDCYSADDLSALEMLAATAAIAIQNAQLFAQIQRLASLDPLTAVPNRRHFYELAQREAERAARYGHPLSMIMLDADHFKMVNDTYGHIAGDQVLQTIAARCRDSLREVDLIARYGGEEFVVLLPNTDAEQALHVARRLAELISGAPIVTDAGPLAVSISLGVASAPGGQPLRLEELLDRADRALYRAKSAGRNQVRW